MRDVDYKLSRAIAHKRSVLERVIERADCNTLGSSKVLDMVELAKSPIGGDTGLVGESTKDRIQINQRLSGALDRIIRRADLDPLGGAKVADMRRYAVEGLGRETIVAVAVQYEADMSSPKSQEVSIYPEMITVTAPPPYRHYHVLHPLGDRGVTVLNTNQGFITSRGRYVGREEAFKIAKTANQFIGDPIQQGKLFSEDLW